MRTYRSHDDYLDEALKDPKEAARYLNAVAEDIGEKEKRTMAKRTRDPNEPIGKMSRVRDFLPPAGKLVLSGPNDDTMRDHYEFSKMKGRRNPYKKSVSLDFLDLVKKRVKEDRGLLGKLILKEVLAEKLKNPEFKKLYEEEGRKLDLAYKIVKARHEQKRKKFI